VESGRTIVTLTGPAPPRLREVRSEIPVRRPPDGSSALAQMRVMALPSKSPLVTFRIVFTAGAAADPR